MLMQKSKANLNTPRTGFSAVELVITATVLAVVTGVGLLGITRARANVRLAGAARQFASYIEKARIASIRNHADDATERASITINDNKSSYNVTLDLDGDGDLDTTTVNLPSGVTFDTVETIAFDWRGRTVSTVSGVTSSNAQVSFRLQYGNDIISIDITGSGDVTIDSHVFDDSVPNVTPRVTDLTKGTIPVSTTPVVTTPTTPDVITDPTTTIPTDPTTVTPTDPTTTTPTDPTTTTDPGDGGDVITNPDPTTETDQTPTTDTTPTTPSVPAVCTITTNPTLLSLGLEGTATIRVSHDAPTSLAITASSSKASDLQVTGTQDVAAEGSSSFTVKSKKTVGIYSITFSSSCGSKTVTVIISGVKLL